NNVQFNILKAFADSGSYVCVIGDDAQNIYQWRGSNISYILNFDKYIPSKTYKLTVNYRSTPEIINIANESISRNIDQIPKQMKPVNKSIKFKPIVTKHEYETFQNSVLDRIKYYVDLGIPYDDIAVL